LNQPAEGVTASKVARGIEEFASSYAGTLYFEWLWLKV